MISFLERVSVSSLKIPSPSDGRYTAKKFGHNTPFFRIKMTYFNFTLLNHFYHNLWKNIFYHRKSYLCSFFFIKIKVVPLCFFQILIKNHESRFSFLRTFFSLTSFFEKNDLFMTLQYWIRFYLYYWKKYFTR